MPQAHTAVQPTAPQETQCTNTNSHITLKDSQLYFPQEKQ